MYIKETTEAALKEAKQIRHTYNIKCFNKIKRFKKVVEKMIIGYMNTSNTNKYFDYFSIGMCFIQIYALQLGIILQKYNNPIEISTYSYKFFSKIDILFQYGDIKNSGFQTCIFAYTCIAVYEFFLIILIATKALLIIFGHKKFFKSQKIKIFTYVWKAHYLWLFSFINRYLIIVLNDNDLIRLIANNDPNGNDFYVSLTCILFTINILLTLAAGYSFVQILPTGDQLASSSNLYILIAIIYKLIMPLSLIFNVANNQLCHQVFNFIGLFGIIMLVVVYLKFNALYNRKMKIFIDWLLAIVLALPFASYLAEGYEGITGEEEGSANTSNFIFGVWILLTFLIKLILINYRLRKILRQSTQPIEHFKTPEELLTFINDLQFILKKGAPKQPKSRDYFYEELITQGIIKTMESVHEDTPFEYQTSGIKFFKSQIIRERKFNIWHEDYDNTMFSLIKAYMTLGLGRFKRSIFMIMAWAHFMIENSNRYPQIILTLQALIEANNESMHKSNLPTLSLLTRSSIIILKKKANQLLRLANHEYNSNEWIFIDNYTNAEQIYQKLATDIKLQLCLCIEFWKKFCMPKPKIVDLLDLSNKIDVHHSLMNSQYQFDNLHEHHHYNHDNHNIFALGKAHLIYAIYSQFIRNNLTKSKAHLKIFYKLEMEMQAHNSHNKIDSVLNDFNNMNSKNNIYFEVDPSPNKIGNIISASSNANKITGYNHSYLESSNINCLMPAFYKFRHDKFIKSHINENDQASLMKSIQTFMLHKNGYVVPVNILLAYHHLPRKGLSIFGLIRPLLNNKEHLLVLNNGFIEGYTKRIEKELGLLRNCNMVLSDICPNLHRVLEYAEENELEDKLQANMNGYFNSIGDEFHSILQHKNSCFTAHEHKDFYKLLYEKCVGTGETFTFQPLKKKNMKNSIVLSYIYHVNLTKEIYKDGSYLYVFTLDNKIQYHSQIHPHEKINETDNSYSRIHVLNQGDQSKKYHHNSHNNNNLDSHKLRMSEVEEDHKSNTSFHKLGTRYTSHNPGRFFGVNNPNKQIKIQTIQTEKISQYNENGLNSDSSLFAYDFPMADEGLSNFIPANDNCPIRHVVSTEGVESKKYFVEKKKIPTTENKLLSRGKLISATLEEEESKELNESNENYVQNFIQKELKDDEHKRKAYEINLKNQQNSISSSRSSFFEDKLKAKIEEAIEMKTYSKSFYWTLVILFIFYLVSTFCILFYYLTIMNANENVRILVNLMNYSLKEKTALAGLSRRSWQIKLLADGLMNDSRHLEDRGVPSFLKDCQNNLAIEENTFVSMSNEMRYNMQLLPEEKQLDYFKHEVTLQFPNPDGTLSGVTCIRNIFDAIYSISESSISIIGQIDVNDLNYVSYNSINDVVVVLEATDGVFVTQALDAVDNIRILKLIVVISLILICMVILLFVMWQIFRSNTKKIIIANGMLRIRNDIIQSRMQDLENFLTMLTDNAEYDVILKYYERTKDKKIAKIQKVVDSNQKVKHVESKTVVSRALKLHSLIKFSLMMLSLIIVLFCYGIEYELTVTHSIRKSYLIKAMKTVNERIFKESFAFTGLYAYIGTNQTSYMRNIPIVDLINYNFENISTFDDFYESLRDNNGEIPAQIQNLISGDLCTIQENITRCEILGVGAADKGLATGNHWVYQSMVTLKEIFDNSDRSLSAIKEAFNNHLYIELENVYLYVRDGFSMVEGELYNLYQDDTNQREKTITTWCIWVGFITAILPIIMWSPIINELKEDINSIKKLLKMLKIDDILRYMVLKEFVVHHSDHKFDSIKNRIQFPCLGISTL